MSETSIIEPASAPATCPACGAGPARRIHQGPKVIQTVYKCEAALDAQGWIPCRAGWEWATAHRAKYADLETQRNELLAALKSIEVHHIELNAKAGRAEQRSRTLSIARDAIDKAERVTP